MPEIAHKIVYRRIYAKNIRAVFYVRLDKPFKRMIAVRRLAIVIALRAVYAAHRVRTHIHGFAVFIFRLNHVRRFHKVEFVLPVVAFRAVFIRGVACPASAKVPRLIRIERAFRGIARVFRAYEFLAERRVFIAEHFRAGKT